VHQVDPADIAATLTSWQLTFVEPGLLPSVVPDRWRPIVSSREAGSRCEAALALWNKPLLDLVPKFAAVLGTRLIDVRVCVTDDCAALAYVTRNDEGRYVSWLGYDPATFHEPEFWASFPEPLQVFLSEVHAGFVSGDRMSFGVSRPIHMDTLANLADFPDGIPGWDEDDKIASTRLLQITSDGGIMYYCVSPDLGLDEIALVYEGDVDAQDLGASLDKLLIRRFER
jgi:hypothetical protein